MKITHIRNHQLAIVAIVCYSATNLAWARVELIYDSFNGGLWLEFFSESVPQSVLPGHSSPTKNRGHASFHCHLKFQLWRNLATWITLIVQDLQLSRNSQVLYTILIPCWPICKIVKIVIVYILVGITHVFLAGLVKPSQVFFIQHPHLQSTMWLGDS